MLDFVNKQEIDPKLLPSVDGEEKITKSDESHYNNILTPAYVQMKLNASEQQVFLKSSLWG